jgi:transposase
VDTQGLPHAIAVTTAEVTDHQGALNGIGQHTENLSAVSVVLTDGGYTGQPFANAVLTLIGAEVHVVKRSELPAFSVIPKRWVVERSFAWLEKCRRLWRLLNTSLQFVNLAFLLRRF